MRLVDEGRPRAAAKTMSSARAARWAAQRASWKLATRREDHFTADRRLYRIQMTELRKEWKLEDLHARRAAYLKEREAQAKIAAGKAARLEAKAAAKADDAVLSAQRAEEEAKQAVMLQNQKEHAKRMKERRAMKREDAEADFRRRWLDDLRNEVDVEGETSVSNPILSNPILSKTRKRPWLTPENFDDQLTRILMRSESPVEKWNQIARKLKSEEQKAVLEERTGGLLQPASFDSSMSAPRSASSQYERELGQTRRVMPPPPAAESSSGGSSAASASDGGSKQADDELLDKLRSAFEDLPVSDDKKKDK